MLAGRRAAATGARRASSGPASRSRFVGMALLIPIIPARPSRGWALLVPLLDRRVRARPAGLAAQQLHARPDRGGAGQRGRRRQLRGRVVRALVRPGDRRRHPARDAVVRVHQHDRGEHGDPRGAAGADRRRRWRTTPRSSATPSSSAARRRAARRPGRGPRDQQRRPDLVPAGRDARAGPRLPARVPELVPDAAAPGHRAVRPRWKALRWAERPARLSGPGRR